MLASTRDRSSASGLHRVFGGAFVITVGLLLASCNPPPWASMHEAAPTPMEAPPAPATGKPPEGVPSPDWAAGLYGRTAEEAFTGPGVCIGNFDGVRPAKDGVGRSAFGWAWDPSAGAPVSRILLVNPSGQIVAAGDGGRVREDVPRARPDVQSRVTGWVARIGDLSGPFEAFGIVGGGSALCQLGRNPG
ncbi:MAG: hypothetical protein ACKOD3_09855 [Phenylobacterium sp.]